MIRAQNIIKNFGEQQVLKDVTCEFERGKTNLIIGRSGAGKTVLLKITNARTAHENRYAIPRLCPI